MASLQSVVCAVGDLCDYADVLGLQLQAEAPPLAQIQDAVYCITYRILKDGKVLVETRHMTEVMGFLRGIDYTIHGQAALQARN